MDYDFLKDYLKSHKITRAKFAEDIGVSVYVVNNWFSREPPHFPIEKAVKIAAVYHINLDDLIGGKAAADWFFNSMLADQNKPQENQEEKNEKKLLYYFRQQNDLGQKQSIHSVELYSKVPEFRKDYEPEEQDSDSNSQ